MKSDAQRLIDDPAAFKRFTKRVMECATLGGTMDEIKKEIDRLSTQLGAARACGLDASSLLEHSRGKKHEHILMCATAVGSERGMRIGKQAAKNMMNEAHEYAVNFLTANAPWLVDVEVVEDDE